MCSSSASLDSLFLKFLGNSRCSKTFTVVEENPLLDKKVKHHRNTLSSPEKNFRTKIENRCRRKEINDDEDRPNRIAKETK